MNQNSAIKNTNTKEMKNPQLFSHGMESALLLTLAGAGNNGAVRSASHSHDPSAVYTVSDRQWPHFAYSTHRSAQSMKHAALRYILVMRSTSRSLWLRCSKVTSDFGYPIQGTLKRPDFQRTGCSALSENTAPKITSRFCKSWLPSFTIPNSHAFRRLLVRIRPDILGCQNFPRKSWLPKAGKTFH